MVTLRTERVTKKLIISNNNLHKNYKKNQTHILLTNRNKLCASVVIKNGINVMPIA